MAEAIDAWEVEALAEAATKIADRGEAPTMEALVVETTWPAEKVQALGDRLIGLGRATYNPRMGLLIGGLPPAGAYDGEPWPDDGQEAAAPQEAVTATPATTWFGEEQLTTAEEQMRISAAMLDALPDETLGGMIKAGVMASGGDFVLRVVE